MGIFVECGIRDLGGMSLRDASLRVGYIESSLVTKNHSSCFFTCMSDIQNKNFGQ